MTKKIVIALGGNAILSKDASAKAQQEALRQTAKYLIQFIKRGDQLIISHGNGPQVGNLLLQQSLGSTKENPAMPLDTAVAMTQGSIGYWLQNALGRELRANHIDAEVATVVTQVEVDKDDKAFENPTKPIGPFFSKTDVEKQERMHPGYVFSEDAGRGYRRVVPSPKPINVCESSVINKLVSSGVVPITVGGGGVPVVCQGEKLVGREAVIDKDFASEKLAEQVGADLLVILTAVDAVYINYNQKNQTALKDVTISELEKYLAEDQFAEGSMLPKVQAAIEFVQHSGNAKAVITSLDNISGFIQDGSGTIISKG